MWDRWTLFSNGVFSSGEVLCGAQDCADGIDPPAKMLEVTQRFFVEVTEDLCNLQAPQLSAFLGFSSRTRRRARRAGSTAAARHRSRRARVHVVQTLNPNAWASNETPICVTNVELGRPLSPGSEEACLPGSLVPR